MYTSYIYKAQFMSEFRLRHIFSCKDVRKLKKKNFNLQYASYLLTSTIMSGFVPHLYTITAELNLMSCIHHHLLVMDM